MDQLALRRGNWTHCLYRGLDPRRAVSGCSAGGWKMAAFGGGAADFPRAPEVLEIFGVLQKWMEMNYNLVGGLEHIIYIYFHMIIENTNPN